MVLACDRPWLNVPTLGELTDPLIALCDNQTSPVYNSEGCALCQTGGGASERLIRSPLTYSNSSLI
jgi:hypothetical protein